MNNRDRTFKIEDVNGRGGRERCNWDSNELREQERERRRILKEEQQLLPEEQPKK
jgi:hypothetical protein